MLPRVLRVIDLRALRVVLLAAFVAGTVVACGRSGGHETPRPVFGAFPRAPAGTPKPSAGCGKVDSPSGVPLRTASGRTLHVWAPPAYDGTHPLPVVLVYHGWGSNGRAFQRWFAFERYVDDAAIVVYPDAAEGRWDLAGDSDLVFFDDALALLGRELCIDHARVFAFGFSMGGKLVHALGCARSGALKAISVGDGSWPDVAHPPGCGRIPVLITHRTRDDDELFVWGRQAEAQWTAANGCANGTDVVDGPHGCAAHRGCRQPVVFCEDAFFDPSWKHEYNHTVREEYRALTWAWFASLS